MWKPWALLEILSSSISRVKLPRPADVSTNCGPEIEFPGKKKRGPPHRVPRTNSREWQKPRRVGKWHRPAATFSMPLHNRFDGLPTLESECGPVQTPNGAPSPHRDRSETVAGYIAPDPQRERCPLQRVRHEGEQACSLTGTAISYPAR